METINDRWLPTSVYRRKGHRHIQWLINLIVRLWPTNNDTYFSATSFHPTCTDNLSVFLIETYQHKFYWFSTDTYQFNLSKHDNYISRLS